MEEDLRCPPCGAKLTVGALSDLCPRCLQGSHSRAADVIARGIGFPVPSSGVAGGAP